MMIPRAALSFFVWLPAHAVINCPARKALINAGRDLVSKIALYDDIKPMDAKAFAGRNGMSEKEVESRYAATGVFVCDDAAGNGQIVVKGNTVVTVYHTLLKNRYSCGQPRPLKGCAFVYKDGPKTITINAKKLIARGECKAGETIGTGNDWAIIELERSLPKTIVPYKVPEGAALQPGKAVTLVGRTSAFNPDPKNKDYFKNPQAFSNCVAFSKDTFKYWGEYQSSCPSADGSSGSAVLTGTGVPTFAGLLSGDMPTKRICMPQIGPGSEDGPFEKNCRGSLLVPVEGKFLTALHSIR